MSAALTRLASIAAQRRCLSRRTSPSGAKQSCFSGMTSRKARWLPRLAKDLGVSAFCLSEPDVGCDAGGQKTHCVISDDGEYYTINGEKKMGDQRSALGIVHRDGPPKPCPTARNASRALSLHARHGTGSIFFRKTRSKCGIRGTWASADSVYECQGPQGKPVAQGRQGAGHCVDVP